MYLLTCRGGVSEDVRNKFVSTYLLFVSLKYRLEGIFGMGAMSDEGLDYLWKVLEYIPKERGETMFYEKL